jgi:hypothetical protein
LLLSCCSAVLGDGRAEVVMNGQLQKSAKRSKSSDDVGVFHFSINLSSQQIAQSIISPK